MRPTNFYRLNEYRISEFADGRLWWDTQFGFGTQVGGPCFIYGDILLLAAQSNEENGFLKMEYLDHLKRFPIWHKTRYVCSGSALSDTATERYLSDERLRQLVFSPCAARPIISGKFEIFRLGQYQISITAEGDISWTSYGGMNRIVGGRVLIESDVLFIGARNIDFQKRKKEFLRALKTHPKWDRTTLWCHNLILKHVSKDNYQPREQPIPSNEMGAKEKLPSDKKRQIGHVRVNLAQLAGHTTRWVSEMKSMYSSKGWSKKLRRIVKKG